MPQMRPSPILSLVALLLACGPKSAEEPTDTPKDTEDTDTGELPIDTDGDTYPDDEDCVDNDPAIHPGALEVCNELDDDCDALVDADDDSLTDGTTYFEDGDGDSYGGPNGVLACSQPEGSTLESLDCDDTLAAVNPDATEVCNDYDDDCDALIDAADPDMTSFPIWYIDADGDTYGDPTDRVIGCDQPPGTVDNGDDCDDDEASISPAAVEECDGDDNDCDGLLDVEDDSLEGETFYEDADGDTYGTSAATQIACETSPGWAATDDDCDDTRDDAYPGAPEYCDGIDNSCDGLVDESSAVDAQTWYADADLDTYGDPASATVSCDAPRGDVADNTDCDDTDRGVHPDASETFGDGVDSDCDGVNDWDADGDGYVLDEWAAVSGAPGGDCNDEESSVYPGASELCGGVDEDCDGEIDEGAPTDGATWYYDADLDELGDPATSVVSCLQPDGYVANADDCDDTDATNSAGCSYTTLVGEWEIPGARCIWDTTGIAEDTACPDCDFAFRTTNILSTGSCLTPFEGIFGWREAEQEMSFVYGGYEFGPFPATVTPGVGYDILEFSGLSSLGYYVYEGTFRLY